MNRTKVVAVSVASLFAALAVGSLAWACTTSASLKPLTPFGLRRDAVTVEGSNFSPAPVEIRWHTSAGPLLATASGPNFSTVVNIPEDTRPGVYYIVAVSKEPNGLGGKAVTGIDVMPASSGEQATPGEGQTTPGKVLAGDLWAGLASNQTLGMADATEPGIETRKVFSQNATFAGIGLASAGLLSLMALGAASLKRTRRTQA